MYHCIPNFCHKEIYIYQCNRYTVMFLCRLLHEIIFSLMQASCISNQFPLKKINFLLVTSGCATTKLQRHQPGLEPDTLPFDKNMIQDSQNVDVTSVVEVKLTRYFTVLVNGCTDAHFLNSLKTICRESSLNISGPLVQLFRRDHGTNKQTD